MLPLKTTVNLTLLRWWKQRLVRVSAVNSHEENMTINHTECLALPVPFGLCGKLHEEYLPCSNDKLVLIAIAKYFAPKSASTSRINPVEYTTMK